MINLILKGMIKVLIIISSFSGIMASFHLVFYPNVGGISISEDWANIIFCFGTGLVFQYCLLHFFTEQQQEEN